AEDAADDRHHDVLDERVDDFGERRPDDHADRQIDAVALGSEFLELGSEAHLKSPRSAPQALACASIARLARPALHRGLALDASAAIPGWNLLSPVSARSP